MRAIIVFTDDELEIIRREAETKLKIKRRNTWMPEISKEKAFMQQYCGQIGNAGLSKLLYGNMDSYIEDRRRANLNIYAGDGGSDIPGVPIDIKTSWAVCGWDYEYQLWVPGWDYKPRWNYVLGLVPKDKINEVHIIGWQKGTNMVPDPIPKNEGRMRISMHDLFSLASLAKKYGSL